MEQDGITFSAAVPSEENVNLILYLRGKEEIAQEILPEVEVEAAVVEEEK